MYFNYDAFAIVLVGGTWFAVLFYGILVKAYENVEKRREKVIDQLLTSKAAELEREVRMLKEEVKKLKLEVNAMKLDIMRLNDEVRR